jgi:DNA (cytosine-5)-methyltransferase 1
MKTQLNELALFAGAGGGILGGHLLGWRTVCAVEWDAYAASILVARQNDGCLPPFPIWDDVQTFDGRPWQGRVDVISGGFPCQDISAAGKGAGIEGERSGMWKHMARIIGEVLPALVLVENSPLLVGRGLTAVLADLAEMGYDAEWGIVGAHHAGAPHKRDRIWIAAELADSKKLFGDGGHNHPGISECGKQISKLRNSGRSQAVADTTGGQDHGRKRGN